MTQLANEVPSRLRLAAIIAMVAAAGSVGISLLNRFFVYGGPSVFSNSPRYLLNWLLSIGLTPAAYIVAAWLMVRGWYAGMLALIVLPAAVLVDRFNSLLMYRRYSMVSVVTLAVMFVIPALVLTAGLLARRTAAGRQDAPAVQRAKRRAAVGLNIVGALVTLLAGGLLVLLIYVLSNGHRSRGDQEALVIVLMIAAALGTAAAVFFIMARRIGRAARLGIGWVIFAFVFGAAIVWLSRQAGRAYGLNSTTWIDYGISIFAAWMGIELLHARRICEEPQSYGFAPIMPATVMTPILAPPEPNHD